MGDLITSIVARLRASPEEMRKLERKRLAQVHVERYLKNPQHEWFLKLARKLETVPYFFVFAEDDASGLIATYDFYLNRGEWFQICFQLSEDGSASVTVYDRNGHYFWEPNDIEELEEQIVKSYNNPKTFESVVA